MGSTVTWEQAAVWLVLIIVLVFVASGKVHYEIPAFSGLIVLGLLKISKPAELFSGFASPALFTVATVLVMSAGIVESGLLTGLGKKIAGKIHDPRSQIFALFLTTGILSTVMNNAGAVGVTIPTARRMAKRADLPASAFGVPIAFASILGGSLTLIGTASNLIVSSYRQSALGEPFKMFDFAIPGLMLFGAGIVVIFVCGLCGFGPAAKKSIERSESASRASGEPADEPADEPAERNTRKSVITITVLLAAIVLAGTGILHPAVAFGVVVLIWLATHVMTYKNAILNVNVSVVLFLGSMFGISKALQDTGALSAALSAIIPAVGSLAPFSLVAIFIFITAILANLIDNSTTAVLMAPVAVEIARASSGASPDMLLMAVAAGASLGIIMPTHQATVVVASSISFSKTGFMKTGAVIVLLAGTLSALVIRAIW